MMPSYHYTSPIVACAYVGERLEVRAELRRSSGSQSGEVWNVWLVERKKTVTDWGDERETETYVHHFGHASYEGLAREIFRFALEAMVAGMALHFKNPWLWENTAALVERRPSDGSDGEPEVGSHTV